MLYQTDYVLSAKSKYVGTSMYWRDTFTLHVDSFHNSDTIKMSGIKFQIHILYSYMNRQCKFKEFMHVSLPKLGFKHFHSYLCAMIIMYVYQITTVVTIGSRSSSRLGRLAQSKLLQI